MVLESVRNIISLLLGIRVDTSAPQYQFSDPDLLKDWEFSQRFPGGEEIQRYLSYVAEKWDLRKDTSFDTYIDSATWDNRRGSWLATASNGQMYRAKFLILCTGILIDKFIPNWNGVDRYKGTSGGALQSDSITNACKERSFTHRLGPARR
jgi:cation diffusion facilitator CzcD-associated flavoprotein CzcO